MAASSSIDGGHAMRPVLLIVIHASLVLVILSPLARRAARRRSRKTEQDVRGGGRRPDHRRIARGPQQGAGRGEAAAAEAQCPADRGRRVAMPATWPSTTSSLTKAATARIPRRGSSARVTTTRRSARTSPPARSPSARRCGPGSRARPIARTSSAISPRWGRRGEGLRRPELLVRRLRPAHAARWIPRRAPAR